MKKEKLNFDENVSVEEYEVIKKFLSFYRNQSVIVADSYRQDFDCIPFEHSNIIFKTNSDSWKSLNFCRKIDYKGVVYTVELKLWRTGHMEEDPKCLSIDDFSISANGVKHFINLDINDAKKAKVLFNIISIFDERKIIAPEEAYSKRLYVNKALQTFMNYHEWGKIDEGLNQMPSLKNALFIIDEVCKPSIKFRADFGTILYQLISFRMNNLDDLEEKDLHKLDELILKLSKTELLKVKFYESGGICSSYPTRSILLEKNYTNGRVHISEQYTPFNNGLEEEQKVLSKFIIR